MPSRLATLRARGMQSEAFREGYAARDAIIRLGGLLRKVRDAAGLSQLELALRADISLREVQELESGVSSSSPGIVAIRQFVHGCGARLSLSILPKTSSRATLFTADF
jgi:transcriptional regulator with XRE-family HTH domain